MMNKWVIKVDVNLIEKETIIRLLGAEITRLQEVLKLTADVDESEDIFSLKQLQAQIDLAWIEREVEIIPPPSRWSEHFPVAVGSGVRR